MLRVIGGIHGGRKLKQPSLKTTRPTTDRAKEALFSMIQFRVDGSIFLDLFSGSGSIAIEASSRGAMKVFAVEKDESAIKVIKSNCDMLNINNINIIRAEVISFLSTLGGTKFDFIFMDPPYEEDLYNKALSIIREKKILSEMGWIIIETSHPNEIVIPTGFVKHKTRKYGKSSMVIISNNI